MVMRRTRGEEAKLGGDRHFEGNWGLHFWMPMVDRKQKVEIEKVDLRRSLPGDSTCTWVSRLLKTAVPPAKFGSPNTTT
jgi:hypothetical protein